MGWLFEKRFALVIKDHAGTVPRTIREYPGRSPHSPKVRATVEVKEMAPGGRVA